MARILESTSKISSTMIPMSIQGRVKIQIRMKKTVIKPKFDAIEELWTKLEARR